MSRIVLSQEQANLLSQAKGPVAICDPNGNVLWSVKSEIWFTDEEVAAAQQAAREDGPGITTQELLAHLRKLAPE